MKSSSEIRFDYQNALIQAKSLEDTAADIKNKVVKKMNDTEQNLRAAWKGNSANTFLKKESALCEDIQQTAQNLQDIAKDIRIVAKRIYDAEMEALRIAQEREKS